MNALTESEQDFARWMEEVDLEEVNLLEHKPQPRSDGFGQKQARGQNLDGAARPLTQPGRGTGWNTD